MNDSLPWGKQKNGTISGTGQKDHFGSLRTIFVQVTVSAKIDIYLTILSNTHQRCIQKPVKTSKMEHFAEIVNGVKANHLNKNQENLLKRLWEKEKTILFCHIFVISKTDFRVIKLFCHFFQFNVLKLEANFNKKSNRLFPKRTKFQ